MLIHDDARPGWPFIGNISSGVQHSKGALVFVYLGLPSSMALAFCSDNPIRPFPIRPQLSMNWVSGCQGDPFKDEVSNVEAPGFYHCIILPSHKTFVSCYSLFRIHPYLVNKIKFKRDLFFILLFLVFHHPVVSHMHFRGYDCFTSIGWFEGSFPCRGPHSCLVSL